jgi:peptide-methionine (S)-S-oxide reductase
MKTKLTIFTYVGVAVLALALMLSARPRPDRDSARNDAKPEQHQSEEKGSTMATAIFGAGCFWGVEAAFRQIEGVKATAVGYAGGSVDNPTYEQVCRDRTGHAEVVKVDYDPSAVSYETLLNVFWANHDPTQVDRQGPDIGSQYRSVVFYTTPEQETAAKNSRDRLDKSGQYKRPIATSIEAAPEFWKAEEYHQQYLEKRGLSTCKIK